ncbi:BDR-repeat family protein (plasmid) [Borrelia nietonii YOR]|uniref:BDR-repeat family protein n=2 Tax=Borrelia TaxID=138 RepID=W5SB42_9SPIR|nr:BDR-repeat family protein [Borrelia nietonii YOR]AHH14452.1 BDR-repeat family protein [Borrelia hermsii MTW]
MLERSLKSKIAFVSNEFFLVRKGIEININET